MHETMNASRRTFLRQASALSLAGTAAPFALNLAAIGAASASDRRRLQGAGVRVPVRRQRCAQHRRAVRRGDVCNRTHGIARRAGVDARLSSRRSRPTHAAAGRPAGRAAGGAGAARDAVRCRAVRGRRQRRSADRADRSRELQREVGAAAAEALLAQRPAVGVAGVGARGSQVRLGRPHRRPAREPERESALHLQLADRQCRLPQRTDGAAVPDRSGAGLDRLRRAECRLAVRLGRRRQCAARDVDARRARTCSRTTCATSTSARSIRTPRSRRRWRRRRR